MRRRPSVAAWFALGVVAAVLAVIVVPVWVLWDWDATPESRAFVTTPQFVLWILVLAGQAAVWVGAGWLVISTLRRRTLDLRRHGALARPAIIAVVASTVALALAPIVLLFGPRLGLFGDLELRHLPTGDGWPLQGHESKVAPLVGIGLVIGFLAIAAMWLTGIGFEDLGRRARARASRVRRVTDQRSELTGMLAVAGVLIGLATLSSGALRAAVLAANGEGIYREQTVACLQERVNQDEQATSPQLPVRARFDELIARYPDCKPLQFDEQYVLAYGLLFSGLLAIAFAPSFLSMREAGTRLREVAYPLPNPDDPSFFDVVERRRKLDDLLQTSLSATATFKAGVAILTPLVASLVSTLLPH